MALVSWFRGCGLGLALALGAAPAAAQSAALELKVVGRGFVQLTDIQFVPGQPGRAVILQKDGKASVLSLRRVQSVDRPASSAHPHCSWR